MESFMPNSADPTTAVLNTLTGEMVARAAAADFRSFYRDDSPLKVIISVENCHIAAFRSSGRSSRIVISPEMANSPVSSAEDFFFHLLIICHEIAHLVNKHEKASFESVEDGSDVEFWADFYSGKALITLLTYGERTKEFLRRFFKIGILPGQLAYAAPDLTPTVPFYAILDSLGISMARLVKTVYQDSNRYPPKILRAGLICNGVTSALRHELVNPDPIWYFSVIRRLLLLSPEISHLSKIRPNDVVVEKERIERIRSVHRNIQGKSYQITPGLKPQFANHLHTRFTHSDEEIANMQAERKADIQAMFDKYPNGIESNLDNP